MPHKQSAADALLEQIRLFGLSFPGAHTKSPWPGHLDLAVKDKTFAYLSLEGEPLGISVKLPRSNVAALKLPNVKPSAYGLGRSCWVSATFPDELPSLELLRAWLDESYRAQAPKKLIQQLDAGARQAPDATAKAALDKADKRARAGKAAKLAERTRRPSARSKSKSKSTVKR
jgi:predicted DNA-binding protein (MmcQ/YjbR family)